MRYTTLVRLLGLLVIAFSVACASPPPPPKKEPPKKRELKPEDVRKFISAKISKLNGCYAGEAINSRKLSAFVFQLDIPNDGTSHSVTLVSETVPGQMVLRECLADVIRSVRFPPFDHDALTTEVPIQPNF